MNDLRKFFYGRKDGQGIWKWDHYFEIYDRHFRKFRNKPVRILEIGVYSGGSLEMWREYFGKGAIIYGVDIQEECKIYEREGIKIFIGDQSDIKFWVEFKKQVPALDIIIDDGSHKPRHQSRTFHSLFWSCLAPGGVYLCEDVHGYPNNEFIDQFYKEFVTRMHEHEKFERYPEDNDRQLVNKELNTMQEMVNGVFIYPYVLVVEKNNEMVKEFIAPKRGNLWAPFKP